MSSKPPKVSPRISTIPYTPTSTPSGWTSVHPRPLRPILPHPNLDGIKTPALPSPPRPAVFHTTTYGVYRLSTHLVPAAFPRLVSDIPLPEIPSYIPDGSPSERRDKMDVFVKQVIETQYAYEEGRVGGKPSERLLWNCVNRYTWETMIRDLLNAPAGEMVDEVWAWDAVQHGDAAVVNAENLSGIFDWLDNTRDIANFLIHYLPDAVEAAVLPTRLPRLPMSVTKGRGEHGYRTRKLVVVGHSFGGCTSLRVAFDFPKLFSSFVLVDPVIHGPHTIRAGYLRQMVLNAFTRRDHWSSREEALQLFQKSSFFGAWNPDVLQHYVDHGLIDTEGGVRLKMSGLQEGLSFANKRSAWETWELLGRLDEGITLRWVVPEQPLSTKEGTYERVWRRPVNSTNVVFHFAGHLGTAAGVDLNPFQPTALSTTSDMNANRIACESSELASPSIVRPCCSGSRNTPGRPSGVPNSVHVRSTSSWRSQERVPFLVFLVALFASPVTVSAAPLTFISGSGLNNGIDGIHRRQNSSSQNNGNNTQSSGNISMNIWLPIFLVTMVFVLFSFVTCIRRCAAGDAATATSGTAGNQAASTPGSGNTTRPRRRPRRTPSQISTKSLPPYMKEPGDHELVLFRGPLETEDDQASPHAIPTIAEDDDERYGHPEMRNATFDIALDRIESVDTTADSDSSSTNLIRRVSESVTRPPELHHTTMPHDHRRSMDAHSLGSAGSDAELPPNTHQRGIFAGRHADPRGEAPSYTEAVSAMTTISLNGPEPNSVSSNAVVPPSRATGTGRLRFSFLKHNPFSSHNNASGAPSPPIRSESPSLHVRSGSALSRFSSRESHESHHSRVPSRNHNLSRSHSRSNSNLFRTFHSHSPGLHAGSSTISLDSISAPLTHTLKRAEFYAPKGGLLTPEQVKLITSREALERFGMPYGPDAVAAFSLSRERLAETGPPPDFESATGEHQERADASGSGDATEAVAQGSDTPDPYLEAAPPHSTSLTPHPSLSHGSDVRADSRTSSVTSYATAPESDVEGHAQAQTVHAYASRDEGGTDGLGEPHTGATNDSENSTTVEPIWRSRICWQASLINVGEWIFAWMCIMDEGRCAC
ncbi:hypothetical protein J3R82DRAFT_8010 [Butyriboletus roseoflavus]|nr:hypothetical protein J3R82DRAFT_8010 [Butyriboletus roseoflavus]